MIALGLVLIAVGAAMLVLPGPGIVVLALGFAILSSYFVWARWVVHGAKHHAKRMRDTIFTAPQGTGEKSESPSTEDAADKRAP